MIKLKKKKNNNILQEANVCIQQLVINQSTGCNII